MLILAIAQSPGGGMADAMDSKSIDRKVMRVRLPPRAPTKNMNKKGVHRITLIEHRENISAGYFQATPIKKLNVGDLAVIKKNNITYQVYKVTKKRVMIGYEAGPKKVRKNMLKENVRDAQAYIDTVYKLKSSD